MNATLDIPQLEKISVLCYLGSLYMLLDLKDIPHFDKVQFYVLALNDELKKLTQLHIMADNNAEKVYSRDLCYQTFFEEMKSCM